MLNRQLAKLAVMCGIVLLVSHGRFSMASSSDWNDVFSSRTGSDWTRLWHVERHRRCYHELLIHMDWVCEKDIYKLRRRRRISAVAYESDDSDAGDDDVFLKPDVAFSLFRGTFLPRQKRKHLRKMQARGIIDECCERTTGCDWEEYAEYCPANRRLRNMTARGVAEMVETK